MGQKQENKADYAVAIAIMLAAIVVSGTTYLALSGIARQIESKAAEIEAASQQQPAQQTAAQQNKAASPMEAKLAPTKEVTMDFLYADWCGHCAKMKPIVQKLESELPAERFAIRRWRDEDRQSDSAVAEVFSYYAQKGDFVGFPTFIINGKQVQAGEMPEEQFRSWVCGQFSSPKPKACGG
ncbi:MAG: thioredoxin family protein [Candidatus Micrarchaeota archaeon]|nr:thioredoxin family protein [Candidatus Micrarchaeota archaeon]